MGVERIENTFKTGRKALVTYLMLGYPTPQGSMEAVLAAARGGADILELGVPFSDPLADGPVIQAAGQRALHNGMSFAKCLEMAGELRRAGLQTPALFMGYYNPFLAYGIEKSAADAQAAGMDGFIIPDLPPEESGEMEAACRRHDLALIYLLAPTSTPERIALAARHARGFIYLVSVTGVTGERSQRKDLSADLSAFVARVRAVTDKPLAVGFGIGSGAQARQAASLADGVIVGSVLVKASGESAEKVAQIVTEIRCALSAG